LTKLNDIIQAIFGDVAFTEKNPGQAISYFLTFARDLVNVRWNAYQKMISRLHKKIDRTREEADGLYKGLIFS
jgi:hypothetical protein